MLTLQYYVDASNRSPFGEWFEELDAERVPRLHQRNRQLLRTEQGDAEPPNDLMRTFSPGAIHKPRTSLR